MKVKYGLSTKHSRKIECLKLKNMKNKRLLEIAIIEGRKRDIRKLKKLF